MITLFAWRVYVDEQRLEVNIDERVKSASMRIAGSVRPLVYNLYQKATDRRFTEETASAILDAELATDFIHVIKVYGNFGHLFMGKFKSARRLCHLRYSREPSESLCSTRVFTDACYDGGHDHWAR